MRIIASLVAFVFAISLGCGIDLEHMSAADDVFEITFSQPTPAGVSNLKGSADSFSCTTAYLKFNASQKLINKLAGPSFVANTKPNSTLKWVNDNISGKKPTWWNPKITATTTISSSTAFHPTHFSGDAVLIYVKVIGWMPGRIISLGFGGSLNLPAMQSSAQRNT